MDMRLIRDLDDGICTMGKLVVGATQYDSLELPWRDNAHGQSCVPLGTYKLERHSSERHPHTWALVNADLGVVHWPLAAHPEWRALVLIHVANYPAELQGCIAPGMARQHFGASWMLTQSTRAFAAICATLPWNDTHTLTIAQLAA